MSIYKHTCADVKGSYVVSFPADLASRLSYISVTLDSGNAQKELPAKRIADS